MVRTLVVLSCLAVLAVAGAANATQADADARRLIDSRMVDEVRGWLEVPVLQLTLRHRNSENGSIPASEITRLDDQWRAEREAEDQPLITSVLSSPLSSYLIRIQARSLGLFSEIIVVDHNGLNAGQSGVTTDYWQGDEAKFQNTFAVGRDSIFVDEAEYHEATGTWRAQLNLTVHDDAGNPIGAATVEVNLTELSRRHALAIN